MSTTSETDKPLSLPSAPAINVSTALTVQPPLSRAGKGPALILLIDQEAAKNASTDSIDPPPMQKWAEESFVVAQVDLSKLQKSFEDSLSDTISFIRDLPSFDGNEKFGVIAYLSSWTADISHALESTQGIASIVVYGSSEVGSTKPTLF
ncbi:hypothetical protein KCU82_g16309, partial [Aureobasidium melanogenum]